MSKYKYKVVRPSGKSIMVDPRSPFSLKYIDGEITEAPESSLGVMVFRTLFEAKIWIRNLELLGNKKFIIKRVIPIGRGITPKMISCSTRTEKLRDFYIEMGRCGYCYLSGRPVRGTICYPAVYVHSDVNI